MTRKKALVERLVPPHRQVIRKRTVRRYMTREMAAYLKAKRKREARLAAEQ
jgi:hypothetical protein